MPYPLITEAENHQGNFLLNSLSPASLTSLRPYLSRVTLVRSQALFEDEQRLEHVFFVESGLVMLIANTGDRARVQVNMVGREGFAGIVSLFDDDLTSLQSAQVQIEGSALRISQESFQEALDRLADFRLLCMRHTKATMLQMSQLAACNARHSVSQRLCRLLLMVQERTGGTMLVLTQEDLALMLGVRRAGISTAIASLEASGIVRQARGCVEVTDHMKLLHETCDCYRTMRDRQVDIMKMNPFLPDAMAG